jgi:hypothetical protein
VSESTTTKLIKSPPLAIAARKGWSVSLGYDTGNPQVYFVVPTPIPVNTVPLWVRVWCLPQCCVGHHGCYWVFAIVVLQMYIIIYNTNENLLAFTARKGGVLPVVAENGMRTAPAHICSKRRGALPVVAKNKMRSPPTHICSERRGGCCL